MRWLRWLLAVALLVVIEGAMPLALRPRGVAPDLLVGLVVALALDARSGAIFLPIWGVGLVRDLTSIGPFGLHAFLFGAAGVALHRLRHHFYLDQSLATVIAGVVAAAFVASGAAFHLWLSGGSPALGAAIFDVALGALLSGVAVGAIVSVARRTGWLAGFVETRGAR